MEDGVEGVRERLADPRYGKGGGFSVGMPLRTDGFEGVREEGTEDDEPWMLRLLLWVPDVPVVDGRYDRTEVMLRNPV